MAARIASRVFADRRDHRAERLVPGDAGPQTFDPLRALGALALDALDASPLGAQLRVYLSPAAGGRAFIRGGPAALNRGNESARLLGGLVALRPPPTDAPRLRLHGRRRAGSPR